MHVTKDQVEENECLIYCENILCEKSLLSGPLQWSNLLVAMPANEIEM